MAVQPNIVVVVADTTRVDDAYDPEVAPTLAELGSSGTRATRAISAAPWTLPSHASLLTGTYPSKHGAHADHERLDEHVPTLQEQLRDAGYETVCVSNNTWLSAESGFDRGFDEFQQMWQLLQSETAMGEMVEMTEESRVRAVARRLFDGNPVVNGANMVYRLLTEDRSDDGAERSTEWIRDWLAERGGDDPFFVLANYLEPHLEYRPPERLADQFLPEGVGYEEARQVPQKPWEYLAGEVTLSDRELEILRGLYRAEIAYFDEQLATLRSALVEAGEWENTVVVVVADHGENVGDHGLMDHQYCLYDTLTHVPLVLHGGPFEDGGDLTDLVSLTDVAPTLLDVADVSAPEARESFQGHSFHPDSDAPSRDFVVSEYMAPQPSMDALDRHLDDVPEHVVEYDRSLRAIRTEEYKLVRGSDGSCRLYDLGSDPAETTDVADDYPSVVEDLETDLDAWLDGFAKHDADAAVSISDERESQLEQLGYLQ